MSDKPLVTWGILQLCLQTEADFISGCVNRVYSFDDSFATKNGVVICDLHLLGRELQQMYYDEPLDIINLLAELPFDDWYYSVPLGGELDEYVLVRLTRHANETGDTGWGFYYELEYAGVLNFPHAMYLLEKDTKG
jgi:hypothetical protein